MDAETFPRIESLPRETETLACSVTTLAGQLLKASSERLMIPDGPVGDWLLLRKVDFSWKLYLAKHEEALIFFFFRHVSPVEVVLDTTVSFTAAAVVPFHKPQPFDASQIHYRIVIPPFVIRRPSPSQMAELAPEEASFQDTILFQVGPDWKDVLAIKDAESGTDGVRLHYRGKAVDKDSRTDGGTWPLEPFLALIEAVRSWVSTGFDRGEDAPLELADKGVETDPRKVLRLVTEAFISAQRGAQNPVIGLNDILDALLSDYEISDYRAKVLLRLTPDGKLASEDKDDPFQLLMNIALIPEATHVQAKVSVGPPDFVISGPLQQAFVASLLEEKPLAKLASRLKAPKAEIRDSLSTFGARCSIFRIKREIAHDTDILVLPGMRSGKRTLLVLRGEFTVDAKASPPKVIADPASLKKLFFGVVTPDSRGLDDDLVRYVLRLVKALRDWIGVMP